MQNQKLVDDVADLTKQVQESEAALKHSKSQLIMQEQLKNMLEKEFARINLKYRRNARILAEIKANNKDIQVDTTNEEELKAEGDGSATKDDDIDDAGEPDEDADAEAAAEDASSIQ